MRSFESSLLYRLNHRPHVRIDYHPTLGTAVTDWGVPYPISHVRQHLANLERQGVISVQYRRGWFWAPRPHVIVRWAK